MCHVSLHVSYNIAAGPPEPAPDAGSAQNPQLDQSSAEAADWQLTEDEWAAISAEIAARGY